MQARIQSSHDRYGTTHFLATSGPPRRRCAVIAAGSTKERGLDLSVWRLFFSTNVVASRSPIPHYRRSVSSGALFHVPIARPSLRVSLFACICDGRSIRRCIRPLFKCHMPNHHNNACPGLFEHSHCRRPSARGCWRPTIVRGLPTDRRPCKHPQHTPSCRIKTHTSQPLLLILYKSWCPGQHNERLIKPLPIVTTWRRAGHADFAAARWCTTSCRSFR